MKKSSAKNFLAERFLGVFKKTTLDHYWFYAIGVHGNNFNTTTTEFGCRHCRPFLKKGSAKNFPTGKILGYFSKIVRSTVVSNCRAFFYYAIGVCGNNFNITNIEFGCRHCRLFFKKRMGFGATPHKNGGFCLQSFFFCAFCAKRKSDVGLEVSLC